MILTFFFFQLSQLQMLGYDMKWAAFNVVEVMSFQSFTNKRIAYSAASQSFDENTDVTMLTTNLIKKVRYDFKFHNEKPWKLSNNIQ